MMALTRRKFSKEFKLRVLRDVKAGKTVAQAAREPPSPSNADHN